MKEEPRDERVGKVEEESAAERRMERGLRSRPK